MDAARDLFRYSQLSSNQTYFVFEQLAQRLDELEVHLLGQPADVVMTLDHCRWTTHRDGLNNVRIKRPLHEITDVAQTSGFFFKHVNEDFSDSLALLFGIGHAF